MSYFTTFTLPGYVHMLWNFPQQFHNYLQGNKSTAANPYQLAWIWCSFALEISQCKIFNKTPYSPLPVFLCQTVCSPTVLRTAGFTQCCHVPNDHYDWLQRSHWSSHHCWKPALRSTCCHGSAVFFFISALADFAVDLQVIYSKIHNNWVLLQILSSPFNSMRTIHNKCATFPWHKLTCWDIWSPQRRSSPAWKIC